MMGLGKLDLCIKFEVASLAAEEILKGKPQISGSYLIQGHIHFFL